MAMYEMEDIREIDEAHVAAVQVRDYGTHEPDTLQLRGLSLVDAPPVGQARSAPAFPGPRVPFLTCALHRSLPCEHTYVPTLGAGA